MNHRVFPAHVLVFAGLPGLRGQSRIEQQHPLLGPIRKVRWTVQGKAQVLTSFLEHVSQRRRPRQQRILNAECQPVGLTRAMVRVLTENHDLNLLRCRQVQRPPDIRKFRTKTVRLRQAQHRMNQDLVLAIGTLGRDAPRRPMQAPSLWHDWPRMAFEF